MIIVIEEWFKFFKDFVIRRVQFFYVFPLEIVELFDQTRINFVFIDYSEKKVDWNQMIFLYGKINGTVW